MESGEALAPNYTDTLEFAVLEHYIWGPRSPTQAPVTRHIKYRPDSLYSRKVYSSLVLFTTQKHCIVVLSTENTLLICPYLTECFPPHIVSACPCTADAPMT